MPEPRIEAATVIAANGMSFCQPGAVQISCKSLHCNNFQPAIICLKLTSKGAQWGDAATSACLTSAIFRK